MSAASGQRLPHRHPTVDLFPMRELQDMKPTKLREIENMPGHTPRPEDRPEHPLRWDEECLRYTSQTKRNFFLGILRGMGLVSFFTVFPISIIVVVYGAFERRTLQAGFFENLNWEIPVVLLLLCVITWGGASLIYRLFPNFAPEFK